MDLNAGIRASGGNSFGRNFVVTTFGESHGGGVGCVIDGVPPNLPLTEADIQVELDRRYAIRLCRLCMQK